MRPPKETLSEGMKKQSQDVGENHRSNLEWKKKKSHEINTTTKKNKKDESVKEEKKEIHCSITPIMA